MWEKLGLLSMGGVWEGALVKVVKSIDNIKFDLLAKSCYFIPSSLFDFGKTRNKSCDWFTYLSYIYNIYMIYS